LPEIFKICSGFKELWHIPKQDLRRIQMTDFLEKIYHHKQVEIEAKKKILPLTKLIEELERIEHSFNSSDFFGALMNKKKSGQTALICEIKRGSPSAGMIRSDFNAAEIAKIYQKSGAACLSVLTDEHYFLGGNEFLIQARKASNLPILRKDFFVDNYQIYEAKLIGANCILLIVAMLPDEKLQELEFLALSLGLSVLVEVHDEAELLRATLLKSRLIGINNRNLKTLKVDIATSYKLAESLFSLNPYSDSPYLLISESGIKTAEEIKSLKKIGINSFLIGEHFMRQANIGEAVENILS